MKGFFLLKNETQINTFWSFLFLKWEASPIQPEEQKQNILGEKKIQNPK